LEEAHTQQLLMVEMEIEEESIRQIKQHYLEEYERRSRAEEEYERKEEGPVEATQTTKEEMPVEATQETIFLAEITYKAFKRSNASKARSNTV
jgi:hypothetical protein